MTKLEIAKKTLSLIEKGHCIFICNAILIAAEDYRGNALKILPELLQFKPEDVLPTRVWFKGPDARLKRIEVLNELIKIYEND